MQGFFGALVNASEAKDTLRSIFALTGVIRNVNVHGAYVSALTAGNAFFRIVFDSQERKIAGGF